MRYAKPAAILQLSPQWWFHVCLLVVPLWYEYIKLGAVQIHSADC